MREVVKANKITRKVEAVYPSIIEAAAGEGMHRKHVSRICRMKTLPRGMYYYRFRDEFDQDESFEGLRNRPVVLVDTVDEEHLWYGDLNECAEKAFWSPTYISTVICAGSPLLDKRYHPMYVTKRTPAASC